MITVYPADHALHNPPHEFFNGALVDAHESPRRAELIRAALERADLGPIVPPRPFGLDPIRAVHDDRYLTYLEHIYDRWVAEGGAPEAVLPDTLAVRWMSRPSPCALAEPGFYASDLGAPIVAGTFQAARASAAAALTGAELLLEGEQVAYALCRPPGHHAGRDLCGGYCYLNNAAIAAEYLLQRGAATRVAILDIDVHHGNGTQQIFYDRADLLTVSIHADPAQEYPYFSGYADEYGTGAGLGYNLNILLAAGTSDEAYYAALDQALARVADFAPAYLVLAAGFDTFVGDPLSELALSAAAYPLIGQRVMALGLPLLIVQEGGYAVDDLGANVVALLRGVLAAA